LKKILIYGTLTLLIIAIGAYITLQFFLGSIVKSGVNRMGPDITQTKVELKAATLSPLSGIGTLTGLSVGNPAGWTAENAFYLGQVHINLEPFSVFRDHIEINEIIIEQPEFVYETKLVASNIGDLLKNIEASLGPGKEPAKDEARKPIKLVVKKFVMRNGRVTLGIGTAAMTMPMPAVELTNLGVAEGGLTPKQLAFAIMRSVTTGVVAASTQALTKVGGTTGAAALEGAKQVGEALKGIFGGKKQPEPAPKSSP